MLKLGQHKNEQIIFAANAKCIIKEEWNKRTLKCCEKIPT